LVNLRPGQWTIAQKVADEWDQLFTEADALGTPFREGPLHLLTWLEPMAAWARGHK